MCLLWSCTTLLTRSALTHSLTHSHSLRHSFTHSWLAGRLPAAAAVKSVPARCNCGVRLCRCACLHVCSLHPFGPCLLFVSLCLCLSVCGCGCVSVASRLLTAQAASVQCVAFDRRSLLGGAACRVKGTGHLVGSFRPSSPTFVLGERQKIAWTGSVSTVGLRKTQQRKKKKKQRFQSAPRSRSCVRLSHSCCTYTL